MSKPVKNKFLTLVKKRKALEKEMKALAWKMAPNKLKRCLCSRGGYYSKKKKNRALEWLIKPRWEFGDKTPAELIAENRSEEVIKFLGRIVGGPYF